MHKTVQIDATPKTAGTPARYIWYPAGTGSGAALEAVSARFGLERLNSPLEAGRGPALLLYPLPEHCICQAFLQDQAPDEALAAWAAQASGILQALRDGGPQIAAAELSQFLLAPESFLPHSDPAAGAAREALPAPVTPMASDPVLLALATACLQQDSGALSLSRALQQTALPAAPASRPGPAAAAQAYLAERAQITLLQEQKNLMHHELETLQSLNRSMAEALRQKIAGKEQALQAAGRKARRLAARAEMLQRQLAEKQAEAQKSPQNPKSQVLRFIAPLRRQRRGRTGGSKA
ncbi:hypothetical protein [Leisingera sp. McT4-56]|uniref:hypothetical protein n=1 Tax=Leisingera sp. McT4-56 TaxID=2881255 RepID=UPI001CF7EE8F|nr:hypothetical protein [Leisingera sp. McT4-56]MCB4457203.1 hypothetical protein [Leisingera sp. McT4-56]